MTNSKNTLNKVLVTVLKYLFFIGTLVFIYYKVFRHHSFNDVYHQLSSTLNITSILYFVVAFVMMFFNWGLESEKWRLMMQRTYPVSFLTSFKATFAGTSFGIFTPNRAGSFVGNLLFVPVPYKAEAAICVWISSASQFLATISFGLVGIVFVHLFNLSIPFGEYDLVLKSSGLIILLTILSIGYLAYFNTNYFITSFKKIKWISKHIDKLESLSTFSKRNLFKYWSLSMMRYVVFVVQFFFVFKAFHIDINFDEFFIYVCLLYAIITFLPSVLGKLGVREAALLVLLANTEFSDVQIISASFALWVLNVVIPAIFGAYFITQIKTK
ncbi:MAG: lysylphosphatidylglycerol synthase domain-containing protein [Bacteroidia bacterium]